MEYNFEWGRDSLNLNSNILKINWILVAEEGGCQWRTSGSVSPNIADLDGYTVYEDITKDKLNAWVESCLGTEQYKYYKDLLSNQFDKEHGNPGHKPKNGSISSPWKPPVLSFIEEDEKIKGEKNAPKE